MDHPFTRKVGDAVVLARKRAPGLVIDGEIQLAAAREAHVRRQHLPFSKLAQDANVLVFPDLQSGNLAMHALQEMGDASPIGPVLLGTRLPAHVVQYGMTVQEVVNLTTIGVVQAAAAAEAQALAGRHEVLVPDPAGSP